MSQHETNKDTLLCGCPVDSTKHTHEHHDTHTHDEMMMDTNWSKKKKEIHKLLFKHDRLLLDVLDSENKPHQMVYPLGDISNLSMYYRPKDVLVVEIDIHEMQQASPVHNTKQVFQEVFEAVHHFKYKISDLFMEENKLCFNCIPMAMK